MKLTLKPWTTEDAERLSDVFNSSRRDYTSNRRPTPYPVGEARRWLEETAKKEETEGLFYAILADEEYVGFITVERWILCGSQVMCSRPTQPPEEFWKKTGLFWRA